MLRSFFFFSKALGLYSFFLVVFLLAGVYTLAAQNKEVREVSGFSSVSLKLPATLYLTEHAEQRVELEGDNKKLLASIITEVKDKRLIIRSDKKDENRYEQVVIRVAIAELKAVSLSGAGRIESQGKRLNCPELSVSLSGSGRINLEAEVEGDAKMALSGSGRMNLEAEVEGDAKMALSGSGRMTFAAEVEGDTELALNGSGRMALSGQAASIKALISGSGRIEALDYQTEEAEVSISGSGRCLLHAERALQASITGSGRVEYGGAVQDVSMKVMGSGRVQRVRK